MDKKIGIYAPWANGDMIMSTPFLKYKDILWPNSQLIWFVLPDTNTHAAGLHRASADIVLHNPYISEIRPSLSNPGEIVRLRVGHRTNEVGHPLSVDKALAGLMTSDKSNFPEFSDLDLCYFPSPTHNCDKLCTPFVLITTFVFNYPPGSILHPCLFFTPDEDMKAQVFLSALPHKYTIMLETEYNSGQSFWDASLTSETMKLARSILGFCNFVFASPKSHLPFFDDGGVVDCCAFTIRQCIPIFNRCNLFIGVGSGISHAMSSWSASESVRRIDCTSGSNTSMSHVARGPCIATFQKEQFIQALVKELQEIKRG